jgi:hypothetical protein
MNRRRAQAFGLVALLAWRPSDSFTPDRNAPRTSIFDNIKQRLAHANATVWIFFTQGAESVITSTFQLVLIAFFSGILVAILFRTAIRTVSQMREKWKGSRAGVCVRIASRPGELG